MGGPDCYLEQQKVGPVLPASPMGHHTEVLLSEANGPVEDGTFPADAAAYPCG